MKLLKVHGSLNTFYLLDQAQFPEPKPFAELVTLAQRLCQSASPADGLLVVGAAPGLAGRMTVINADGSLAKMCGNGLRTVARYLSEQSGQSEFTVQTEETALAVRRYPDFAPGVPAYGVQIAPVSFDASAVPFAGLGEGPVIDRELPQLWPDLRFTVVAVPNPHLIAFGGPEILQDNVLGVIGKRLNAANPYFPEGVNVTFATEVGPNQLFARTYERGVGFTNACGTGMSATSLAWQLTHPAPAETRYTVFNPGGVVNTIVHQGENTWIELIGNASVVTNVTYTNNRIIETDTEEQGAYASFVRSLAPVVEWQTQGGLSS